MKKLIQGIIDFRDKLTPEKREMYARLALGQKPDALLIVCSDSRVAPNYFASTNPGDLFVLRNAGNLVPPSSAFPDDNSAAAVIEYAIFVLNVQDIIICGHSECGAMQALIDGVSLNTCPHIDTWLKYAENSLYRVRNGENITPSLSLHNRLSQSNVLQQMEHILSYPFIRERVDAKKLHVHGWWFDIANTRVFAYEQLQHRFIEIDEREAKSILDELDAT